MRFLNWRRYRAQQLGITVIREYLYTQYDKGLVEAISCAPTALKKHRIGYETYWVTHRDILLPEIERIAAEHQLRWVAHARPVLESYDPTSVELEFYGLKR